MRSRRPYYNRDPEEVPEHVALMTAPENHPPWWRAMLEVRTFEDIFVFYDGQPADIRDAGHELLESFMDDPKQRPREIYEIYRGRAHRKRRVDEAIAWQLTVAAQKRVESAKKTLKAGTKLGIVLYPLEVVHDQVFLLHSGLQYVKHESGRGELEGMRGGPRHLGLRASSLRR